MDWLIDARNPTQRERCARVDRVLLNGEVVHHIVAAAPDRVLRYKLNHESRLYRLDDGELATEVLYGDVTIIDKE